MAKLKYEKTVSFYSLELTNNWNLKVVLVDEDGNYIRYNLDATTLDFKKDIASCVSKTLKAAFDVEEDIIIPSREKEVI